MDRTALEDLVSEALVELGERPLDETTLVESRSANDHGNRSAFELRREGALDLWIDLDQSLQIDLPGAGEFWSVHPDLVLDPREGVIATMKQALTACYNLDERCSGRQRRFTATDPASGETLRSLVVFAGVPCLRRWKTVATFEPMIRTQ